jgi:hypothetical protein
MTDLIRVRPTVWCEIEGQGRFEIAQFTSHFYVNQIPGASVTLAVGRRAYNGTTAANIHSKLNSLSRAVKVQVYAKFAGDWDEDQQWPEGTYKIFDGRLMGVGYQKVSGKIMLSAHLIHWLADLNYTSIIHSRSHPSNEVAFAFNAATSSLLGTRSGADGGITRNAIASSAEARFVTPDRLGDDLWSSTIKPLFCNLAKDTHVQITPDTEAACGSLFEGNDSAALEALGRIEGISDIEPTDCDLELSCYTKKLAMFTEEDGALPVEVAVAAADAIGTEAVEAFASQTVWGKLLQYANQFLFTVVPQVDRALVVPAQPGTRSTFCKTIKADEYAQISLSGKVRRPIRALALIADYRSNTGALPSGVKEAPPVVNVGLGGCFAPEDIADNEGQIIFTRPPHWLQNLATSNLSPARTTGRKEKIVTGSATTPVTLVDARTRGTKDGKMIDEVMAEAGGVFNGVAHALYIQETLRGRSGYIPGKLRFDIAPGSTVVIEGTTERFLPESEVGQNIIATVVGVGIAIDAEKPAASTTFQLNYCRTEQENSDDKTSMLYHPLYRGSSYDGAPLIPDLWFENDDCCEEE